MEKKIMAAVLCLCLFVQVPAAEAAGTKEILEKVGKAAAVIALVGQLAPLLGIGGKKSPEEKKKEELLSQVHELNNQIKERTKEKEDLDNKLKEIRKKKEEINDKLNAALKLKAKKDEQKQRMQIIKMETKQ